MTWYSDNGMCRWKLMLWQEYIVHNAEHWTSLIEGSSTNIIQSQVQAVQDRCHLPWGNLIQKLPTSKTAFWQQGGLNRSNI